MSFPDFHLRCSCYASFFPGNFLFVYPASEWFKDTALTERGYGNRASNELQEACCMFGLPADASKSHTYLRNSLLHCNLINTIPTNPQYDWHHGKCGMCISFHSLRNNDLAACLMDLTHTCHYLYTGDLSL